MITNIPDTWRVIKFQRGSEPATYKVFAGWYGGYTGGDYWQLNSGIVGVKQCSDRYEFEGTSGSIYVCYMACEKLSSYQHNILSRWIDDLQDAGVVVDLVDKTEYLTVEY